MPSEGSREERVDTGGGRHFPPPWCIMGNSVGVGAQTMFFIFKCRSILFSSNYVGVFIITLFFFPNKSKDPGDDCLSWGTWSL